MSRLINFDRCCGLMVLERFDPDYEAGIEHMCTRAKGHKGKHRCAREVGNGETCSYRWL